LIRGYSLKDTVDFSTHVSLDLQCE